MKKFHLIFFITASLLMLLKFSQAKDVKLSSKNFQKEFLQKISANMKSSAKSYLNNFLKEIEIPANAEEDLRKEHKLALDSKRLETKIVFIKQYLDMAEHRDMSRDNMYGLRNVVFLKKLKDKLYLLQEESFEEMHQLRYYYLCKQFKVQKAAETPLTHHNYYSKSTQLMAIGEENVGNILGELGLKDNHTISVNITQFGNELYQKVNEAGSDVINDYLIVLKKLLLEVLEPQSEEEAKAHSEALRKILEEIDVLLQISDFYSKRQRLYDYLENHLAVDYEQIQSSESSQHDLMEVFNKLKEKGLDMVMAYLFSNFEFIDYLQDQWILLLPQAPISLYDERSCQLKKVQQLYSEFKQDFENSIKYDAYLEAVKLLHERTQQDNTDTSHIYEMLYSASQNVGSSRATLMIAKCNEI